MRGIRGILVVLVITVSCVMTGCSLPTSPTSQGLGTPASSIPGLSTGQLPTQPLADPTQTSFLPPSSGQPNPGQTPHPSTQQVDPGSLTGGSGSAADNVKALVASGATSSTGHSNDGRLTFTQYGGSADRTPDANTSAGLGNRGNQLRATSLALSPNLIRQYGLTGGEEISIRTGGRTFFLGHYDDTTGNNSRNNVIDVYDPNNSLGQDDFMANIPAGGWELVVGNRVA